MEGAFVATGAGLPSALASSGGFSRRMPSGLFSKAQASAMEIGEQCEHDDERDGPARQVERLEGRPRHLDPDPRDDRVHDGDTDDLASADLAEELPDSARGGHRRLWSTHTAAFNGAAAPVNAFATRKRRSRMAPQ